MLMFLKIYNFLKQKIFVDLENYKEVGVMEDLPPCMCQGTWVYIHKCIYMSIHTQTILNKQSQVS